VPSESRVPIPPQSLCWWPSRALCPSVASLPSTVASAIYIWELPSPPPPTTTTHSQLHGALRSIASQGRVDVLNKGKYDWLFRRRWTTAMTPAPSGSTGPSFPSLHTLFDRVGRAVPGALDSLVAFRKAVAAQEAALGPVVEGWPGPAQAEGHSVVKRVDTVLKHLLPQFGSTKGALLRARYARVGCVYVYVCVYVWVGVRVGACACSCGCTDARRVSRVPRRDLMCWDAFSAQQTLWGHLQLGELHLVQGSEGPCAH
jgi:hypothetical protein